MRYQIAVRDNRFEVEVSEVREGLALVTVNGEPYEVIIENFAEVTGAGPVAPRPVAVAATPRPAARPAPKAVPAAASAPGGGAILAPIPGLILDVRVKVGDTVAAGQVVATMEAMKMENNITAAVGGKVKEVRVQKGSEVATGDLIMIIA